MQLPEIEGYELLEKQGEGTFGTTYRAVWGGQLECCLKTLRLESIHAPYLSWCLERLSELPRHPGVVAIYGYQIAAEPRYITTAWHSLVQDGAKSLEEYKGKLPAPTVARILLSASEALVWLHEHNIIHTGLTARNIIVLGENFEDVRITDMGQGRIGPEQIADWSAHSPYLAPERCRGEAPRGERSGEAWDIYSFGVIAYRLLTGIFPRATARLEKESKRARAPLGLDELARLLEKEAKIKWPSRTKSPPEEEFRRIVERCLDVDPDTRYQHVHEIQSALSLLDFPQPERLAAPEIDSFTSATLPEPKVELAPAPKQDAVTISAGETTSAPTPAEPEEKIAAVAEAPLGEPTAPTAPRRGSSVGWKIAALGLGLTTAASLAFAYSLINGRQTAEQAALAAEKKEKAATAVAESARAAAAADRTLASEKEAQATQALADQKLSRENLRQSQEVADRLLDSLLDQRPADDLAMDEWRQSLSKVAIHCKNFIEKFKDDPTLRESCARSRWHLAGIRLALGENETAGILLEEAARDVDAIAAATAGNPEVAAEWTLLMGRIQNRRGQIAVRQENAAEAAQYLAQSTKAYEAWLETHPDDPLASRELAQTSVLEGRALAAKGDATSALARFSRSCDLLARVEVSGAFRDEDLFLLADSHLESARAHISLTQSKEALESCRQAMEPLLEFDGKNPQSIPCRERLADGYILMGRVLGTDGTPLDSSKAYTAAIRLLLDLVGENPAQETYQFDLGRCYGEAARLIRSANQPQDALQAAQSSVDFLRRLVEKNQIDSRYRMRLAEETVTLAEIHEDMASWAASAQHAKSAITVIDELLAETDLSADDRKLALRHRARAFGSVGHSAEKMTKKDEAITAYSKALETWQKLAEGGAADETAARSLAWTQEQLKRLKPGS